MTEGARFKLSWPDRKTHRAFELAASGLTGAQGAFVLATSLAVLTGYATGGGATKAMCRTAEPCDK